MQRTKQVFALCDYTHVSLYPWRDAGFECHAVDIRDARQADDGVIHHKASVLEFPFSEYDPCFALAFPPCTHLAASGARWWREKGESALNEALGIVSACREAFSSAPTVIENPVGRLSTHWRKPDAMHHPYAFAGHSDESECYSKLTCLWLLRGACAPAVFPIRGAPMDMNRIHHASSGARDKTPHGLAMALFLANKHHGGL